MDANNNNAKILLYGATGFTGKLALELVASNPSLKWFKDRLVLGGRHPDKVRELAKKHQLPFVVFSVDSELAIDEGLQNISVLLNMAGPFILTVVPLIKGCMKNKVHYLDITGEQSVLHIFFENYKSQIKDAGIFAIPACGFDAVPTDCLAAMLKEKLPSADKLDLGLFLGHFDQGKPTGVPLTKGTMVTLLEALSSGNIDYTRKDGKLVPVNPLYRTRTVEFKSAGKKFCGFIPTGDVYAGYFSTGIPNIDIFFPVSENAPTIAKFMMTPFIFCLRFIPFVKTFFTLLISYYFVGPEPAAMKNTFMDISGEIYDSKTKKGVRQNITTGEPYTFTAISALEGAKRVLLKKNIAAKEPGVYSPSSIFGKDFVKQVPDVTVHPSEEFSA